MLLCCVVGALALYIYSGVYTTLIYIYAEQQFNARFSKANSKNEALFNYSYYFMTLVLTAVPYRIPGQALMPR